MRQIFTNVDKEKLLDLIIDVAMLTHESGIQIADKLEVPSSILIDLRNRSPRAALISPCNCKECIQKNITRSK